MLRTQPLARDAQTVAGRSSANLPAPSALPGGASVPPAPAPEIVDPLPPLPLLSPSGSFHSTLVSGSTPPATGEDDGDPNSPYRTGAIIAGRYRLLRQLGRGGMGEVWSAHHLALNTEFAVKFLSTGTGVVAAKMALERFRFESQISARLAQKTAHVVAVHDAGSDAAGPYLVMEYVRGRTLRAELNSTGPLDPEAVASLIDQVAEALTIAHRMGVVHRDLKPSNLLLVDQPDGSLYVKVADFGIAKAIRGDLGVDLPEETCDGWMLGSPAYMSPEQMSGGAVDARSDVWALGVIVYEALTGRLPFPGRCVADLIVNMSVGRFEPPSTLRPSLPTEVDDFCLRALAKRKAQRFESVDEMARELRQAIQGRSRRVPRVARGMAAAVSLVAALLALRPAPSEALPEREGAAPPVTPLASAPINALASHVLAGAPAPSAPPPAPAPSEPPAASSAAAPAASAAPVKGPLPGHGSGKKRVLVEVF